MITDYYTKWLKLEGSILGCFINDCLVWCGKASYTYILQSKQ